MKKEANILRQTSDRDFLKLRSSIERIHNEKLESKKLSVLEEDKVILESNLQTLIDNLSKLSLLEDVNEKNKEADIMIIQCEKIKRDINISIRECREDDTSSVRSDIQGKPNNLNDIQSLYGEESKTDHFQQKVNAEEENHRETDEVKDAAHCSFVAGGNDIIYSGLSENENKFTPSTFSTSQYGPVDSVSQIIIHILICLIFIRHILPRLRIVIHILICLSFNRHILPRLRFIIHILTCLRFIRQILPCLRFIQHSPLWQIQLPSRRQFVQRSHLCLCFQAIVLIGLSSNVCGVLWPKHSLQTRCIWLWNSRGVVPKVEQPKGSNIFLLLQKRPMMTCGIVSKRNTMIQVCVYSQH